MINGYIRVTGRSKYVNTSIILKECLPLPILKFQCFQAPEEEVDIDDGTSKRSPPENEKKCAENKPDVVMSIPNMMEMNTVGGILVNMPHVITHGHIYISPFLPVVFWSFLS